MEPSNSLSEIYTPLWTELYLTSLKSLETIQTPSAHESLLRSSRLTISSFEERMKAEGVQFATITLPTLGKALDRALSGTPLQLPKYFRKYKAANKPVFLRELFELVFDDDGRLLGSCASGAALADRESVLREIVQVEAVRILRQLLFFLYKLELPYPAKKCQGVLDSFLKTEEDLVQFASRLNRDGPNVEMILGGKIARDMLSGCNIRELLPKHGPGMVATGEIGSEKYLFKRKYLNVHRIYPYYSNFMLGMGRELVDRFEWYRSLEVHLYPVAKIVYVPKDSRGPRLICEEPLETQWIQQGILAKAAPHLEVVSRGHINFRDQSVNQRFAKIGSVTRTWSTLDLKEASDRISLALMRELFDEDTLECVYASRSFAALLPSGEELVLEKAAPMGSATCFLFLSLIVFSIAVASIVSATGCSVYSAMDSVYVYGDDLVVETVHANRVIHGLESCGLLVNRDKSFINSPFLETCGFDAFLGHQTAPLRLKLPWSEVPDDGKQLVTYVALAQNFERRGNTSYADFLYKKVERLYGKLPYGLDNASYPCRLASSYDEAVLLTSLRGFPRRFAVTGTRRETVSPGVDLEVDYNYQRVEFKVRVPRFKAEKDQSPLDSWQRLLRSVRERPTSDPDVRVFGNVLLIKRVWIAVG